MKFLKAGGTAVDAVEVAIKSLEDREITNAGYGSNLTIDGVVEGDATIVDHLGRSGACGAVPMIKNPISLARLILDQTNIPLSLRRIPPNILVSAGARRFAEEHGMRTVPNEKLVHESAEFKDDNSDIISDTVGAIAVDFQGNIAAGSSSGGIGMKHSGRMGPAALVGIGTAVLPANPKDKMGTSVAAVTSGTGEHMATTMASHTCAERLYYNMRVDAGGSPVAEYDDDTLMKTFVSEAFMDHPGVKNQVSGGAIGVMAVKKTCKGVYFYFAHNTDSFALASLSSNEKDPLVVMSRLGSRESVARGGRKIKNN
ncbi:asparaginase family protein [Grosmannia clavigera kw1407]|uniref:Asparaginase family protein n=1 Tax=Grosmannia clavigera (strain kw1407 / UAMH 11150) TaxID=655863 RepID=F0X7E4_GROCL|nr:asparaginase family protein [Grosmannia clavigera kw1407]EFX06526.1 asparaginase family protein [Grosmannia clavigera kw1407]